MPHIGPQPFSFVSSPISFPLLRALQSVMKLGLFYDCSPMVPRSCDFRLRFLTPIAFRSASTEPSHLTAGLHAHSVPSGDAVSYWDVLVLNICVIVNNYLEGSGH
jgi:hypothetical protein